MPLLTGPVVDQTPQPMPDASEVQQHLAALQKAQAAGDKEAAAVIAQRLEAARAAFEQKGRLAGMKPADLVGAGVKAGLKGIGNRALDIAGSAAEQFMDKPPGWKPTPEDMEKGRREREDLGTTTYGTAGKEIGEQAALLPVGLAAGKAASAASRGLRTVGLRTAGKALAGTAGRAAIEGGAMGALSDDDEGEGAATGAAGGYLVAKGAGALRRLYRGVVQPSAAAKALRRGGVDLTVGQMNPRSAIGQIEEASQSVGGFGRSIENQRTHARSTWQDAVVAKVTPPGEAAEVGGTVPDRLDRTYKNFQKPYAKAVDGEMAYPAAEPGSTPVFKQDAQGRRTAAMVDPLQNGDAPGSLHTATAQDPLIDEATQKRARAFLDNQMSLLPGGTQRPQVLEQVPAETLQKMRSNIRQAVRDRFSRGDLDAASTLVAAEEQVSRALETQLSPDKKALLRATDRQYARYKTVESASAKAGDRPGGFTPNDLSQAVKQGAEKGWYGRGGGGELRQLARNGREVFDARVPPTGARYLTVGPLGYVTAPLAGMANAAPVKRFLAGETSPQRAMTFLESAIRRGVGRKARRELPALLAAEYGARREED